VRTSTVNFSFLPVGKSYLATIYTDGPTASYDKNPQSYAIRKVVVKSTSQIKQLMATGGGFAISIREASAEEIKKMPKQ